jgi:hypothetical protein
VRVSGLDDELAIPVAVGFFAIRSEEIGPARAHVPRHVLHDESDAVGFRIEDGKDLLLLDLTQSLVSQPLQLSQLKDTVVYKVLLDHLESRSGIVPTPIRAASG